MQGCGLLFFFSVSNSQNDPKHDQAAASPTALPQRSGPAPQITAQPTDRRCKTALSEKKQPQKIGGLMSGKKPAAFVQ